MHPTWQAKLKGEFQAEYFQGLVKFLKEEREAGPVYPPSGEVFTAFEETPLDRVLVVILGQDPYHGAGQAHGMSFSVKPGVRVPPSLANMYKELKADLGIEPPKHGYLRAWARRGVFLLNTVLTVREKAAGSHRNFGWEKFTDAAIRALNEREAPVVFLLWGKPAQEKSSMIDTSRHVVLPAAHPSPMSASTGFFGSKPFSKANEALVKKGLPTVDWTLPADPNEEVPLRDPISFKPKVEDDIDALLASEFG